MQIRFRSATLQAGLSGKSRDEAKSGRHPGPVEFATPDWTRRFIFRLRWRMQSSGLDGFIIDQPRKQEPGKPGDAFAATPGGEIRGDLNRPTGRAGRHNGWGNLEIGRKAAQTERRSGATRRFTVGEAGGCGNRGNPRTHREVIVGSGIWGDPRTRSDESRRALGRGETRGSDAGSS